MGGRRLATSRRVTDDQAYDASTGVFRRYRPGRGLVVVKDYPLGPPDRWASPLTGVDFGATLRALQPAGAFKLEETMVDGRPAWTMTCSQIAPVLPSGSTEDEGFPTYKVTVDKQTWLLVRFQQVEQGVLTVDLRYLNVRVNEPLPEDAFTLRSPRGLQHQARRPGVPARDSGRGTRPHGRHAARARLRAERLPAWRTWPSRLAR